uniref:tail fiber domain-containing protein n=1 Tax=Atlantibacter hermannii TaxID=565 RepID=UPI00254A4B0E
VPVANGGTGATTAAAARAALGVGYGTLEGTVAQGNDVRLNTVNGKTGGTVTGTVEAVIASSEPAFKSPLAATFQQAPGQFRNVLSHIILGNKDQVMIQDAYGDSATIQARTIVQSASGVFKIYTYDHQGNATAPGSWVNNSDERLKTNIARVSDPLGKMRMLRGVTWDRIDGVPSGQGFIAQELKEVFPTAVFNSGEKMLPDGTRLNNVLSVDLAGAAAALHHEAILVLMDEKEAQQLEIEALKS